MLNGKSDGEKLKIIRKMLDERKEFYEKADIIFERDGFSLDELLEKLERIISEQMGDINGNG